MTKTKQKHKCKICHNPMTMKEEGWAELNERKYDLWECVDCGYQQSMRIVKMKGAHK
jgi:Zn ribbon nucleic-acid-binding protein